MKDGSKPSRVHADGTHYHVTVLTILTMGVITLLKVSIKRQKEQQLREALRQMRTAIDEFHT
jgi:type II secretory pathway pseudopilin PulG